MDGAKEAVRYGIETLKVSPDKMFSLIESSREYEGDDYQRWLARKIIEVAEREGVGFSQLLVKKFDILQDLLEESEQDSEVNSVFLDYLTRDMSESVYTVGLDKYKCLDDVDWFTGVDYGLGEMNFYDNLPDEVREDVDSNSSFFICTKLSGKELGKKTDLMRESKKILGSMCKSKGALMLYRMCSLADVLRSAEIGFSFIVDSDFLCNKENAAVVTMLLESFTCEAIAVKSSELYGNSFIGGKKLLVRCKQRYYRDGVIEPIQDCIKAREAKIEDGKIVEYGEYGMYSQSSTQYIDYIVGISKPLTSLVPVKSGNEYELGMGLHGVICYLQYTHGLKIVSTPIASEKVVPVTRENFWDVVVYYGVSKALSGIGLFSCIPRVVNGHSKYKELVYNCLPLFLFDVDTQLIEDRVVIEGSEYKIENNLKSSSEVVSRLLADGEVYFSFESKELCDICIGFAKYIEEVTLEQEGKTFDKLRYEANNKDLNEAYLSALLNLKDYVSSLYRTIQ